MDNVFIGMPTGGTVRYETMCSLIGAMDLLKEKGVGCGLMCMAGGYVAHNRNNLVREAQKRGSSHIMFIDADHEFAPSTILRLLDHDKDIIAANYNTRGNTNEQGMLLNVLKPFNKEGKMDTSGDSGYFDTGTKLLKVAGIGTGFMLIKMSVFEIIDKPWFVAWEEPEGEHHTEDIEFCIKAREAGFEIWCSPTIKIGHIGTHVY